MTHAHAQATEHREAQDDSLDEFLDGAKDVLATITNIHDFDRVADTLVEHRRAVDTAAKHEADAAAASLRSASVLRDRTRQLKSIEALQDRIERERTVVANKAEQQSNDELAARRR